MFKFKLELVSAGAGKCGRNDAAAFLEGWSNAPEQGRMVVGGVAVADCLARRGPRE